MPGKSKDIFSSLEKFYNEQGLLVFVLVSLCAQAVLTISGGWRKYKTGFWFTSMLWVSYQVADWIPTFSLGVLSRSQVDARKVRAFWAPFFVFHICSPDSISAYSMEDNELWFRHALTVAGQFMVAIYVLNISWKKNKLDAPAVLLLVVGMVKFAERIFARYLASFDGFRDSMNSPPDPGPSYDKFVHDYSSRKTEGYMITRVPLVKNPPKLTRTPTTTLKDAYYFFQNFKRLFADLILSSEDREISLYFFRHPSTTWERAFRVVELELGFVYDVLYTKAVVIYSVWGFLHLITIVLVIADLVVYSVVYRPKLSKTDDIVTLLLVVGAVLTELIAAFQLLWSDWQAAQSTEQNLDSPQWSSKKWSNSVSQFNLLCFCLKEKKAFLGVHKFFHIYDKLEKLWYKNREPISDELKQLIFARLLQNSEAAIDDSAREKLLACRGKLALEEKKCFEELGWSIHVEVDQSIILWHTATDLCYSEDLNQDPNLLENPNCRTSKLLSNYMLYLLVFCPFMLPNGIGRIRFQDTCAEAKEFLEERKTSLVGRDEYCTELLQVETYILPSEVKGDKSKSMLFDACRLAKTLRGLQIEEKWEMISHVWVEMLSYAASKCGSRAHAKQLVEGGELLTHVWLLMTHLGLSDQFQVSEGHGRVKLILK